MHSCAFLLVPVFLEGRVLSYPNPQAAYQANHFGQIDAVTEGAYSILVVSQDGGANSAVTILPWGYMENRHRIGNKNS